MTTAQQTGTHTSGKATVPVLRRPAPSHGRGRLVFAFALIAAALGLLAFGIYTAVDDSTKAVEEEALVSAADAAAARMNAKAEFYASGATGPIEAEALMSAEAIQAYGNRWEARGDQFSAAISPQAIDAYGARWVELGEQFSGTPAVSPEAVEAYGERWIALGEHYNVSSASSDAIDAYGARWSALAAQIETP